MLSLSMFICLMTCLFKSLTHVDLSSTVIMLWIPDKSVVYELTTSKSMSDSTCGIFIFWSDPNKFDISLTVSFPGIKYLISEGIGLKFKSDIIFLDFVAVVNIILPWIDFKAAMISSWWSIIVFSAWSACLFKSQNVFLTVFLSSSISFCSFSECLVIPSINCFSLFLIVVIDSSHKDSYLTSLICNSSTFARQKVKSALFSSSNFSGRIFSMGSNLCSLCLDEIQSDTQVDHRFYRINTSSLSGVLYTEYCPLLFSVAHLEIAI